MPTLFDKQTQDEMLDRLGRLTPASPRHWGKMSASQMLKHMKIAFSVPINKIVLPKDRLYYITANPFTRWVMISLMTKWPKNMLTVDAFKIKDDPEFESSRSEFLNVFQSFLSATDFSGSHPAFGVMSKEQWGQALYIHLDHHLTQFGV